MNPHAHSDKSRDTDHRIRNRAILYFQKGVVWNTVKRKYLLIIDHGVVIIFDYLYILIL